MVLSIILYKNVVEISDEYSILIRNWNAPPITDIKAISSSSQCASGYKEFAIYHWPGLRVKSIKNN